MKQQRLQKLYDIPLLLDVYGCLLTERQREALSLTYEEDCSLAEIAALHGSSRQAVHDLIERGTRPACTCWKRAAAAARWWRS